MLVRQEEEGLERVGLLAGTCVTLVLPCLNEEQAVGGCVIHAIEVMERYGLVGSVLVVDNGSTDDSVDKATAAGAHVIYQPEPGYGAALRSGFEASDTEFVIMADADGTYEFDAIPKLLLPLVTDQADLVLGSRLNDATVTTMPWLHRFIGTPVISYMVRRATNSHLDIRDSQSGFRAFRREQILALQLSSTGMEFASEMLIRCSWAKLRICEVDTSYAERIGESKLSTFSDGLRHLRQILLLSPDAVASIPGVVMTTLAIGLWLTATLATQGLGSVGSLSWLANMAAGILSVIGPMVICTGLVLRYRAESLGLRHAHVRMPLGTLIRRFFFYGLALAIVGAVLTVTLIVNYHLHDVTVSRAATSSFASFIRSAFVVGIMLMSAPLISPFLMHSPRLQLPAAEVES